MSCKTCGSKKNSNKKSSCSQKMGPGKLVGSKKSKKQVDVNCSVKCDANACQKNDLKKPSKRNVRDPEIRKTNFVTGDRFPSCPPTDKDTFFYHTRKNMIFTYNRRKNEWQAAHCGTITVETATTESGPTTSGPFTLDTCGDTLRLWSAGGIFANATPGSALVQIEPNIIHCGSDPENFMPADPTRPALYFNSSTGNFFVWDPESDGGTFNHWHTASGGEGSGTNIECEVRPGGENDTLAVDKAILTNIQGLIRIFLDEDVFFLDFGNGGGILSSSEFQRSFNTLLEDYILTESGLLTLPPISFFNNTCLDEGSWEYIVEVNIKMNFRVGFLDSSEFDDFLIFALEKNEGEVVSQIITAPYTDFIGANRYLNLVDTLVLAPGDILNFSITKNEENSDAKLELLGGSENCVINFKILGLNPVIG